MKRFYQDVSVSAAQGGWQVLLDGRAIKTAGGQPQTVRSRALAEALAAEWASQGDTIDPASFALRDLADYAIDTVSSDPAAAIADLVPYAETDTLCYRADDGTALHLRQAQIWEPGLTAAEIRWDARFERVEGIMHRPQPAATLARIRALLEKQDSFALAALRMLASLSASLVIALSALEADADPVGLWNAANLEEDWQAGLWGRDAEAENRRQARFEAFQLAIRFARLAALAD